jgi:hypothetical protein
VHFTGASPVWVISHACLWAENRWTRPGSSLIRAWIDQGAEWPDSSAKEVVPFQKHWAYIPPKRPPLPKIATARWPKNAIDYFILARLEREKLPHLRKPIASRYCGV